MDSSFSAYRCHRIMEMVIESHLRAYRFETKDGQLHHDKAFIFPLFAVASKISHCVSRSRTSVTKSNEVLVSFRRQDRGSQGCCVDIDAGVFGKNHIVASMK